jgi:DNA-directed RNA polymerase specialized sigma24 family protein
VTLLAEERTRLVRLCARLTGSSGVAEDLAQETLLEAWRNQQKLAAQDRVN